MSDEVLRVEVVEGVATLTLNRPEKRNALNQALVQALKDALARVAADDDVSVVAIRLPLGDPRFDLPYGRAGGGGGGLIAGSGSGLIPSPENVCSNRCPPPS